MYKIPKKRDVLRLLKSDVSKNIINVVKVSESWLCWLTFQYMPLLVHTIALLIILH